MKKYNFLITGIVFCLFMSCESFDKRRDFITNSKVDSTYIFYDGSNLLEKKLIYEEELIYVENYYDNGVVLGKGYLDKKDSLPIGKWKFYNIEGSLSDFREYIRLDGEVILNQICYYNDEEKIVDYGHESFNSYGDTKFDIGDLKSSCIQLSISQDTVPIGSYSKVLGYLFAEKFKESELDIFVFDSNESTPFVFSDSKQESFYFENLARDTINQRWYEDYKENFKKMSVFGKLHDKKGNDVIRGYFRERVFNKDTLTNKIFFEIPIYVVDSIGSIPK